MAWEIDRFGVKPSGLFAKWRYTTVVVDENGNITNVPIPGKEVMNLPFISDYKKNDRRYSDGQMITEYCNLDTFTNYRIYATNERPFARVETDINAAKCGYEEPLPEPAVPSNPFGNPSYGVYRTFSYCDVDDANVNVTIEAKNYDGLVFPIKVGGRSPVILSYKEVDDKFEPIRPLECKLSFVVEDDFVLQEFYSNDERTFRVTVEKYGRVQFKGYIIPDSCSEPFDAPPYEVTIRATDAIGGLKSVTYPVPVGSSAEVKQSFVDILAYCFAMTNLNLNIATICNLYEEKMPTGLNDDPLSLASVNPLRLSKDSGVTMSVYEVLEQVSRAWGGYIVQSGGVWNFVRVNELSNTRIRRRNYNYKGLFLYADNLVSERIIGALR